MTCAFDRKINCNGMSTAHTDTDSIKFTFNDMTSIATNASKDNRFILRYTEKIMLT